MFEAAWADQADVPHTAVLPDGTRVAVPAPPHTREDAPAAAPALPAAADPRLRPPRARSARWPARAAATRAAAPTSACGPATTPAGAGSPTPSPTKTFRRLLPEADGLPVTRHVLPNLRALNFVVDGLLGEGVASQARFDPQAKALGEWLRARHLDIPEELLP